MSLRADRLDVGIGGRTLVRALDLECATGSFTVVIGPNGAGKSTLVRTLCGLRRPSGGRVDLDGQDLSTVQGKTRAQAISFVPQATVPTFPLTVREMVALGRLPHLRPLAGLSQADRRAVDGALAQLELGGLADRRVDSLSGGERQRAVLARALATQAKTLVLDEPTTGLDVGHALDLLESLRDQAQDGRCIIVVLHELELARRYADQVVCLHGDGRTTTGPAAQVMQASVLDDLFRVRTRELAGGLSFEPRPPRDV